MTRTALIAGSGRLPIALAQSLEAPVYVTFDGTEAPEGTEGLPARIEQLGVLFAALKNAGVSQVCFAGAMARPKIDPALLDAHAMRLAMSFGKGDDALLREVLAVFSEQGFDILSAADLIPDLVLDEGTHWGAEMSKQDGVDAARALAVIEALGPLDVGQGAVAAGGLILGIETLQGTDAMLDFVAQTPDTLRRAKGVFVKTPKAGQDLRIDMPTIGLSTVEKVIDAGLGGIVIPANTVIVLDAAAVKSRVEEAGIFLHAQ